MVRSSEPKLCYGYVGHYWAPDERVPASAVIRAGVCPTSGPPSPFRLLLVVVLGSWVGARRRFRLSLFLTVSRVALPKILVLTPGSS